MSKVKQQKVIPLNLEHKRLLLTIFKQGYITEEQKQIFSSLFECKTYRMVYVSKREDLEQLEKMYKEIEVLKMRKEKYQENGLIETNDMSHEAIKRALNED